MGLLRNVALILCGMAAIHEHIIEMVTAEYDAPLGVVYGMEGSDLPVDPKSVVELCHKYGFQKIRLLDPNQDMMDALRGQFMIVSFDIRNDQLPMIAEGGEKLQLWYDTYLKPYRDYITIEYIVVGNEAIPGPFGEYVGPAILAIQLLLRDNGLETITVTTALSTSVLGAAFPPSNGAFKSETSSDTLSAISSLVNWYPRPLLMVNLYPYNYFAAGLIRSDFATFSAHKPVFWGDNHVGYWNMLDALLDAFDSALKKTEFPKEVNLVVGASGWPSAGNSKIFTRPTLASTYNQNLMRRLARKQGTPGGTGYPIRGFVYALFNENKKPAGPDQYFGLFYSNKTQVYRFSVPQ
jgi:hypothetical protein